MSRLVRQIIVPFVVCLLGLPPGVAGSPVYAQAWGGVASTGLLSQGRASSPSLLQELADDFVAGGDWLLGGLGWNGTYLGVPDTSDLVFRVRFYDDAGGLPATSPFWQGDVAPGAVRVGDLSDNSRYHLYFTADLAAPVQLVSGTRYWMSIYDVSFMFPSRPNYLWAGSTPGAGNGTAFRTQNFTSGTWQPMTLSSDDRAFQLFAVSAPATLPLLALPLALTLASKGRRWSTRR